MKNNEKKVLFTHHITYVLQGCSWCDVLWKNLTLFALGGILDPRVLCGQLLRAFISISVLTHVVFSQWSSGPCGQASSRGQPNDGTNEFFPCVHVWSGLCIACPYPCWQGSMRYVAKRYQQRHGLLMCLFCQLLSDVWHRMASVVKTKSVDRLQLEQIKQDKINMVKPFDFYPFSMYFYLSLCHFISFFFNNIFLHVFYICLYLFTSV